MASSSSQSFKYDVFLSFRGEDTRKNFVDHLYEALEKLSINTYKDDEKLPRGESIRPALFKAIEESHIALIIFSENYANSSWCLDELAHIMKCKEDGGLIVYPIFYGVDPSEVRKREGEFGKGFANQEAKNTDKVEIWKNALVGACDLVGWDIKNTANGHEAKAIKKIVGEILGKLLSSTSDVDESYVGMMPRLQELEAMLDFRSDDVRMVGICGVGGGGKTTLANSMYMKMSRHFEGHCFVENIREQSGKGHINELIEKVLSRVLKTEVKVDSTAQGKRLMKWRLRSIRVLIVLDDVDKKEQLEVLAGAREWFGSGSRIIITTRDEHMLNTRNAVKFCKVKLLSNEEAIQLFDKHAYNEEKPIKDYKALSSLVVSYASGLPLALIVLGSFLYDKDEADWDSALKRLENNPRADIVGKLKISYDGLAPDEKEIFLDIACFFRRCSTKFANDSFEAYGNQHVIVLTVLKQKSLITEVDGKLDMHDLVQEMGHYIARGKHPNNPETHSRVWRREDINKICFRDPTVENHHIQAIRYYDHPPDTLSLFYKVLSNMKKLRFLYVGSYDFKSDKKGPDSLSDELEDIRWYNHPNNPFPDSWFPSKLVVLKLFDSFQEELWRDEMRLPSLKVLVLVGMRNLRHTPNFDTMEDLQHLTLESCQELEKVHESLGRSRSLEYVSVSSCYELRMFPTIHEMGKLKTLKMRGCDSELEFPEIKSDMKNLKELSLENVVIDLLLSSIGERCVNLTSLNFYECYNKKSKEANFKVFKSLEKLTLHGLNCMNMRLPLFPCNLQKLDLGACGLKDGKIPPDIQLSNLRELDLSSNGFTKLDFNISQLTKLELLNVSGCEELVELPELPSNIAILKADYCTRLTAIGDSTKNCKWLCDVSLNGCSIINDSEKLLQSMLQGKAVENHCMFLHLKGHEIAKGFTPPLIRKSRCRLKLPQNWFNDFCGFLVCFVSESFDNLKWEEKGFNIFMKQVKNGNDSEHNKIWEEADRYKHTLVWYVSFGSLRHTEWWNETYKAIAFDIGQSRHPRINEDEIGFRVKLVRKSGSGQTYTSTEESEFSHYAPNFKIENDKGEFLDKKDGLDIWLRTYDIREKENH